MYTAGVAAYVPLVNGMVNRHTTTSDGHVMAKSFGQVELAAKDALVQIRNMSCGLPDTFAYYSADELQTVKKTCAFQPRVIKQNRGSAGEGIWLVWLEGKSYCKKFKDAKLEDGDKLKLMEMNDNHVEYHTVKEFIAFCVDGPSWSAGLCRRVPKPVFARQHQAALPLRVHLLLSRCARRRTYL